MHVDAWDPLRGSIAGSLAQASQVASALRAARPEPLMPSIVPSRFPTKAKQSPPMPVICGSVMHKTAEAVTAASMELPPPLKTSSAARVASGDEVAAMPLTP